MLFKKNTCPNLCVQLVGLRQEAGSSLPLLTESQELHMMAGSWARPSAPLHRASSQSCTSPRSCCEPCTRQTGWPGSTLSPHAVPRIVSSHAPPGGSTRLSHERSKGLPSLLLLPLPPLPALGTVCHGVRGSPQPPPTLPHPIHPSSVLLPPCSGWDKS